MEAKVSSIFEIQCYVSLKFILTELWSKTTSQIFHMPFFLKFSENIVTHFECHMLISQKPFFLTKWQQQIWDSVAIVIIFR